MKIVIPIVVTLGLGLLGKQIRETKGEIMGIQESIAALRQAVADLPARVAERTATLESNLTELRRVADEYASYRVAEDLEDTEQNAEIARLRAELEEQITLSEEAAREIQAEADRLNSLAVEADIAEPAPADEPEPADDATVEPAPADETAPAPAGDAPASDGPGLVPDVNVAAVPVDSEVTDAPASTDETAS